MALNEEFVMLRNDSYEPDLHAEGVFLCPMPKPPSVPEGKNWRDGLKPHERLYYHQTMASARCSKRFRQYPNIPKDSLEYRLLSRYDHSREIFPEKVDSVMQRETCNAQISWSQVPRNREPGARIMDHTRVLSSKRAVRAAPADSLGHPLRFGGLKQKINPNSIELICSGIHSQVVNNGFSRQPSDGNYFRY